MHTVIVRDVFRLATGYKKKQFVASQKCEKAFENRWFSAVFQP
jgi:hypothetical protein